MNGLANAKTLKTLSALPRPGWSLATWIWIVAAVLVVGIVALLFYLWRRRQAAAPAEAAPPPEPAAETAVGDGIALAWRTFVKELPGRARQSLEQFHPVVVMGTESSEKEALIARFSGVVHRRAEIGAPAQLTSGDLRLHLGGDTLVMELSEVACRARMDTVDGGLRRAFGPMLRRKTPIVVVCVSPETLEKRSEQELRELAGAMRAKIELLAELRGEPLEVRLALPQLPGALRLNALYLLVQMPGVSPVLPLGNGEEPPLRAQLLAFTDLLSEALVVHRPEEALGVVELLEAVPRLSQALASLAGELLGGGEADSGIRSGGLYLIPETGAPNPLRVPDALARPQAHPLIKHRLIVVTAAAAAAAWVITGYLRRAEVWATASTAAAEYDVTRHDEEQLRHEIRAYAGGATGSVLDLLFPRYFLSGPPAVGCAFVERIRRGPLRDELTDQICRSSRKLSSSLATRCAGEHGAATAAAAPPEDLLYVLGLLYAWPGNDLGTLVRQGREEWAEYVLTVPIIDDYLDLAGPNRDVSLLEELWSYDFVGREGEALAEISSFLEPLSRAKQGLAHPATLVHQAGNLRELLRDRGRFGHAAAVADSRAFEQKPLVSYAPVFARYRTRLELLQELAERRPDLERVIDTVTGGALSGREAAPAVVPALVERLGAILDEKHDAVTLAFELGVSDYQVDLAAVSKALRDTKVRALVDAFAESASHNELMLLGFAKDDEQAELPLRARWPQGVSSVPALPRPFTRAGFEKSVKPHLLALGKLLGRMGDLAPQRDHIVRIVGASVESYADDYAIAIDQVYGGFKMAAPGAVGLKRVLRVLAGGGSPLRDFLDDVVYNTALGLGKEEVALLEPLRAIETKYEPVAKLAEPGKGSALVAYQDILRDAVLRLDAGAGAATAQSGRLGAALSPLGRLSFESLSDPKSSPLQAAHAWAQAQRLDDELARPFFEPLARLGEQASGELARSLEVLDRDLLRMLDAELLSRYPFNPRAVEEVDPDELDGWLNPKRGRVVRDILAAVTSLIQRASAYDGTRIWAPSASCSEDGICAKGLQPLLGTVNDLARVTALLWTEDGKMQPLRLRILPHPLQASGKDGPRPVAVRLVVGDGHVDYFNQKPAETVLEFDWTRRQTSTLSVDLASTEPIKSFEPPAVVVSGTPWSALRLLQKGRREGSTLTWKIPTGQDEPVNVSLTVRESVTDAFRIGAGALHAVGSAGN